MEIFSRKKSRQLNELKVKFYAVRMKVLKNTRFNQLGIGGEYDYSRYTRKIVVTVFGSCRQDSISKHFKTTPIRDGLTYPHYSKEIIQAINYVKSNGIISPKHPGVFRNIQIGLPVKSPRTLNKWFNKTDVFVVEIASRISYEFDGDYFHHVAYDEPLGPNGPRVPGVRIVSRVQSDDEIRKDMATIKSLLEPKPVIFVTHFCTYTEGSRSRLRDLIIEQAQALKSTSFDPSQMLLNYPLNELVEEEPVISHFSSFGHELLAGRYQLVILEEYLTRFNKNRLIYLDQVLDSSRSRVHKLGTQGLGDSGLGLAFLYRWAIANGRIPGVNARMYFASKYLVMEEKKPEVDLADIKTVFHQDQENLFLSATHVFTNKKFSMPWDVKMRDFLISKLLTPTLEFSYIFEQIKVELGLMKPYEAIHIRFDDSVFKATEIGVEEFTNFLHEFSHELVKAYNPSDNYLVLSNSNLFNSVVRKNGFKVYPSVVAHSGNSELTEEETLGILIDFFLLSHSKTIHQISSYGWGSGFSQLAANVYDIPILSNELLTEKLKVFFKD